MLTNSLQRRAFDAVAAALPFAIDHDRITVDHGVSYTRSPIKAHDYAAGVMSAFGAVTERLGAMRGLPMQTMTLNRRLCGLLLNSAQLQFMNGYGTLLDTWPIGPDNGTYRAKDGRYVTMIGLHPHLRDALLDYLQCANSAEAIQAAVAKKDAQQLEDEGAARRLCIGIMRSPEEWLAHPQGAATARRPMVEIEQRGDVRTRVLGPAYHRPLEGVRVIEMAHLVAGPTAGRLLAEQGADVIKIQPPVGDWVLPLWLDVNWGKKSTLLDVKGHVGKRRLLELLSEADVLVNSNSPGVLDRLGLDAQTLREVNPNLVVANASFAPAGTPWAERKGFEQIGQAVAGLMHVNSQGLEAPQLISVLINDYLTGYLAAIGAIAALAAREERGGGWQVGASLMRCSMMATTLTAPVDDEPYAPVTLQDFLDFGVDQETPLGTFTRLSSAVAFSHTPSMALRPVGLPGMDLDTIGWSPALAGVLPPVAPHQPSRFAREGLIRNLIESNGIEDRGDGGGGLSLASKLLFGLVLAARARH